MGLVRSTIFSAGLFLVLAVGCKAQTTSPANSKELNRRIEVLVRSQFRVPPQYAVTIGEHKPSDVKGFDTVTLTFAVNDKSKSIDFLVSTDGKTLAKLETFDLSKDPSDAISLSGRSFRGNPQAKVTIVNYDDLECPYCARMHQLFFPLTQERYKDMVRFVYKDDPLTEIHPWAMHAAINANCLGKQKPESYWGFVDYLHSHGQEVDGEKRDLKNSFATLDHIAMRQAGEAKLDVNTVQACINKQDETEINASRREAEALGVDGTPSVFINGEHLAGLVSPEQLWMVIDRALRAEGITPPPMPEPAKTGPSITPGK